ARKKHGDVDRLAVVAYEPVSVPCVLGWDARSREHIGGPAVGRSHLAHVCRVLWAPAVSCHDVSKKPGTMRLELCGTGLHGIELVRLRHGGDFVRDDPPSGEYARADDRDAHQRLA